MDIKTKLGQILSAAGMSLQVKDGKLIVPEEARDELVKRIQNAAEEYEDMQTAAILSAKKAWKRLTSNNLADAADSMAACTAAMHKVHLKLQGPKDEEEMTHYLSEMAASLICHAALVQLLSHNPLFDDKEAHELQRDAAIKESIKVYKDTRLSMDEKLARADDVVKQIIEGLETKLARENKTDGVVTINKIEEMLHNNAFSGPEPDGSIH